ncbi:hypothetical protein PGT21_016899 [Puccinia graminis f. sp. tritici]|uniref:Protein kinase domain-containing protein n=1 Tax=Puccinia graminis f. sp. tritici TaxID=56615 RepID=A0A5B0NCK9_PUCGR|nr:hypothetical protein PGT21_016899 [Puccinia graminis f. sp. tritici]
MGGLHDQPGPPASPNEPDKPASNGGAYGPEIDLWSFGVSLFQWTIKTDCGQRYSPDDGDDDDEQEEEDPEEPVSGALQSFLKAYFPFALYPLKQ